MARLLPFSGLSLVQTAVVATAVEGLGKQVPIPFLFPQDSWRGRQKAAC